MINTTDSVLFDNSGKGITVNEVERIQEKCDRYIASLEKAIEDRHFVNKKAMKKDGVLVSDMTGSTDQDLQSMQEEIDKIIRVKHLQKHLQQGYDTLSAAKEEVGSVSFADYCKMKGIDYTEPISMADYLKEKGVDVPPAPVQNKVEMSEKECLKALDMKTRVRMLITNSMAAAMGKQIHPAGGFAKAREEFMRSASEPSEVQAIGNVAVITNTEATVDAKKVEDIFFRIQSKHRELEAEYNRIKASLAEMARNDEQAKYGEFKVALEEYQVALNAFNKEYDRYHEEIGKPNSMRRNALEKEMQDWKNAENERLFRTRIIIPKELEDVYNEVEKQ